MEKKAEKRATMILALRNCAAGSYAKLARELDMSRSLARYHIQQFQELGLVTDYIPVVKPSFFGYPFLVTVKINPNDFKLNEDLVETIQELVKFLKTGINHAPVCIYERRNDDEWQVNLITMCNKDWIQKFIENLAYKQSIAEENIGYELLEEAHGIAAYSKFSYTQDQGDSE